VQHFTERLRTRLVKRSVVIYPETQRWGWGKQPLFVWRLLWATGNFQPAFGERPRLARGTGWRAPGGDSNSQQARGREGRLTLPFLLYARVGMELRQARRLPTEQLLRHHLLILAFIYISFSNLASLRHRNAPPPPRRTNNGERVDGSFVMSPVRRGRDAVCPSLPRPRGSGASPGLLA